MVDGVAARSAAPLLPHPLTGELFPSPVPAGEGWPGDPSAAATPVAADADDVRRLATSTHDVAELSGRVAVCRACPRLVSWREAVAVEKRAAFAAEPYWGRPIAGWGAPDDAGACGDASARGDGSAGPAGPRVLVVGLAPAAHGGNRTGRIFTGDRSGDWLFAALHRAGLAAQPTSLHAGDGQRLVHTRMLAAVRCAPPANKPTPAERDTCSPWLDAELALTLPSARAVVCLGLFAWECVWQALGRLRLSVPRPRPRFGHGTRVDVGFGERQVAVLGCYHPSQQNTFTGKLTEPMLDAVLGTAAAL